MRNFAASCRDGAGDADDSRIASIHEFPVDFGRRPKRDAVMVSEVPRMRWPSPFGKVGRRPADDAIIAGEPLGDQRRVAQRSKSNREVAARLYKIEDCVGDLKLNPNVRISLKEQRHQPTELPAGKRSRCRDS